MLAAWPGPAGDLLEILAGGPLIVETDPRRRCPVTPADRARLAAGPGDTARAARGMLRDPSGNPVAESTAVIIPARLPGPGSPDVPPDTILARAMREDTRLFPAASRRPVDLRVTPADAPGGKGTAWTVRASAVLASAGLPSALITHRFCPQVLPAAAFL